MKEMERELATAEATEIEFSSSAKLPSPPELPDPATILIAIVVDELRRAIPFEQQGDVFGRVAAAFKEANPAECLAECRRIMDRWKEEAKSSDEQEAMKHD